MIHQSQMHESIVLSEFNCSFRVQLHVESIRQRSNINEKQGYYGPDPFNWPQWETLTKHKSRLADAVTDENTEALVCRSYSTYTCCLTAPPLGKRFPHTMLTLKYVVTPLGDCLVVNLVPFLLALFTFPLSNILKQKSMTAWGWWIKILMTAIQHKWRK